MIAFSTSALAATITVNTLVDENNVGASCSLREAITAANNNTAFGGCAAGSGPDAINITVNGTINLTAALPNITSSMTISGNGANLLTVRRDTGGNYRIFHIPNGGLSVEFAGITIANGNETGGSASGGGIRSISNLTLTNVHMTGNSASSGSALAVENATGLIIGSTFSANAGFNGVIETDITDGFTYLHRIRNSTISGNSTGRSTIVNRAFGTPSESVLVLENCTVVGNTAPAGSAIQSDANGASVVASTRLLNTIVAGNSPSNLSSEALSGGVADIRTNGFNLSDNFNGAFTPASTDIVASNPGLGPLAFYGGPTPTHALLAGSPALDKGSFAGAAISTDQRGLPRPIDIPSITAASGGNNSDIGAYELQAIEVTNTNDAGGGSLRAAIATAASNGPSVDEIVFSTSVFNTPRTIALTTGELFIGSNVNVLGPGANLLSVSGNNASRVFQVGPGATVSLSGMTITGGNAGGDGGGVFNDGTLTVSQVNIIGNRSAFNGGGIGTGNGDSVTVNYSTIARNTAQNSGAILSNGSLTILRSTISGNTALAGAGAILVQNSGSLNMQNATITANRVTTAGGISGLRIFSGSASIGNSIIAANIDNGSNPDVGGTGIITQCRNCIGNAGALTAFNCSSDFVGTSTQPLDPRLAPLSNYGGPTLTHALLGDSQALDAGGNSSLDQRGLPLFDLAGVSFGGNESDIGAFEAQAILVTNANDANAGSLRSAVLAAAARPGLDDILFGSESNPLFNNPQTIVLSTDQILLDSNLNLIGPGANLLTVSGNNARRVFQVPINRTASLVGMRITGGSADNGGGISNNGRLTVSHVAMNGNTASNFGGGIFGSGGAVTTVASSTLSGNTANGNNTGGGIDNSGDLTVTDSTVSGNAVPNGSSNGGGIWIGGVGQIVNSTVTNNSAVGASSASGVFVTGTNPATLRNSVVAANSNNATLPDVVGLGLVSRGFNLIGNRGSVSFAATGDQSGTGAALLNPLLGALQNNGGTTVTHAMLAGSPALDKGDRSGTTVDQRGAARPSDFAGIANTSDGSDIGAFEAQGTTDPIPTASASAPNVSTPGSAPVSYQVTVVYADDTAINVSTINTSDIVVTGPNAYSATPVLVSAPGSNGTPRTAFYTLNAPGGAWAVGNNGTYTISMRANEVSDSAGSFVPPGPIGSFTVNIQPVAPTVNYSPAAGSTISFPDGPAGNADSTINVQSVGGIAPGRVSVGCSAPAGFTIVNGGVLPLSGNTVTQIVANLQLRCTRGASAQTGTFTCTESPDPGSSVQRSWTLNCPAAEVATPPALAFNPGAGSTINYTTGGTASAIAVTPSGGSGSGAAATTTLGACTITGGGAAFPTTNIAQLSFVGTTTTAQNLALPNCVPQAGQAVNATLSCPESRGGGAAVNRSWTLACPAGAANTPPSVSYTPAAGSTVGFPAGAAGTATSSIAISSSGGSGTASVSVTNCTASEGFTITNAPINFSAIPGTFFSSINLSCTRGANAQSGSLSCTETPSPGAAVTRSWPLNCPAAAADLIFRNGFEQST